MQYSLIISNTKSQIVEIYTSYKLLLPKDNTPVDALTFFKLDTIVNIMTLQLVRQSFPTLAWVKVKHRWCLQRKSWGCSD